MLTMRALLVCLTGFLLAIACESSHGFRGTELIGTEAAIDIQLVDQRGSIFRLGEHKGTILVTFFGYTFCPDVCPMTLSKWSQIEDALNATKAAVEEGVVPGAGVALLDARKSLDSANLKVSEGEKIGVQILRRALEEPARLIIENAGFESASVINEMGSGKGYDLSKSELKLVDLLDAGIHDPVKVTRLALENAASVAMMLLTTEAVVVDIPEKEDKGGAPAMPAGGMGGMPGMGM